MLRSCTRRLSKQHKLLTKLYPTTIYHSNIRSIQSLIHNNTFQYHKQSFNKSPHFHPLQTFNTRSFTLPDHEVIGLPALSPSVEESKIVSWKANEGDFVAADTAIASVQTDKAELDWMVTDDIYLAKILLEPGIQVPVGTPVCIFVEDKSHIDAFKNYSSDNTSSTSQSNDTPPTTTETPSQPSQPTIDTSNYPEHRVEGMPALSPTAVDGALVEWLVKEGDMVEEGSGIAEIQTDKSVVTWTSTDEAYVAKLLVPVAPDNKLAVGTPLAIFVDEKNDVNAFKDYIVGATPTPAKETKTTEATKQTAPPAGRQPSIEFRHGVRDTPKQSEPKVGSRIFVSPYAKKLAKEMGIALDSIGTPTGVNNRIVAADVIKTSQQKPVNISPPQPVTIIGDRSYEDIPVSVMREIIGKRLSESKFTAPHFYTTMECIMDNLIGIREEINKNEENKISINDIIIKACAYALYDTPNANVGWIIENNKPVIRKYNYIDISVAVATPNGLITPIIQDANKKSLIQISLEMKDLAKRAKENKLLPEEFQGGTFTISNMGMFGISNFTAIINPPQACILAVGATKKKLFPDDTNAKGFKTVNTMEVTLSSDHRSVDGALAAQWINAFQKYIEQPAKLMR